MGRIGASAELSPARAVGRSHRQRAGLPVFGLLGMVALHAQGQGATEATPRQFVVSPSVSVTETFTDNATLTTEKHSDLITQVSPAVRISSNAGRVQGYFDYSLSGLYYANGSQSNSFQQALSSAVKAEVVPNFANIDGGASISRQNISALGTQSSDSSLGTSNQTEVRSFNLSPYIHGQLGSAVAYKVRADFATTHTDTDQFGNSTTRGGSAHLGSDGAFQRLNWAMDVSRFKSGYSQGSDTQADSAVGTVTYNPIPDLRFSVRAGKERNNYTTFEPQTSTTYGGGVKWVPSPRMTVSIQGDKHSYGNSYDTRFEYRTPRTVWSLYDTRSVSTSAAGGLVSQTQQVYDLTYLLLTSLYPDPVERQRQTLLYLQSRGVDTSKIVPSGFLANTAVLQQNKGVSFAYNGLRTTLFVSAQQGESRGLGASLSSVGGLPSGSSLQQRSVSATLSHRLTPIQTISLDGTQSRSTDLTSGSHVDLTTVLANWSTSLGQRSRISLAARHSISKGDLGTSDYTESAMLATFTLQF